MDQNRDGFIDKSDLRDTFAALGRVNVKQEEIDEMLKEAPGPVNFTVFLTMFGEKLKGADPEETILNAFKVFDPEATGILKKDYVTDMLTTQADRFSPEEEETFFSSLFVQILPGADPEETILNAFKVFDPEATGILKKDYVTDMLTTQADRFSPEEMEQMFLAFPPDVAGNLDYKNLVYIITHGEDKDQE
ncbi:UNVERIFIED_CONTAM: hypothetical protein FKN15_050209 [Acipenser sinensis]